MSDAWEDIMSIVIVRHPLSRLASVYYNKFIEKYQDIKWASFIEKMIKLYRTEEKEGVQEQPTPNEFIKYFIEDL